MDSGARRAGGAATAGRTGHPCGRRQAVPAEPAYQRRRHRSRRGGPVRAWTRMPVEASASPSHSREPSTNKWPPPCSGGGRNAEDFDESLVILHELRSYARRGAARLYGVINGLLRMRNGLRRSQELDDLVDVLASSIGALTNPRTNCPHRRRSRRRSLAARDRRQLPEDRPRTRRGQTRPRRARHPHDERLRFPPRPGQPDDVTPWIGYNVLDSPMRDE